MGFFVFNLSNTDTSWFAGFLWYNPAGCLPLFSSKTGFSDALCNWKSNLSLIESAVFRDPERPHHGT
ncbi:MAG: hypothetical protein MZV64_00110 [Ignavibacteriales bacterium]|nr:hypothetical protein [Ignavibacteriales bacterium]